MSVGEVSHMNVIAYACAVGRRIIRAEYLQVWPQAERSLRSNLDQMCRAWRRLASSARRIGAGDVEIAQGDEAQVVRSPGVAQHDLGHQFRSAVRRDRLRPRIFGDRIALRYAVDGGGRGENKVLHLGL